MVNFIGYLYFMQTFMPLCITLNCTLTTVIMLVACSKWGKWEWPLLSGHRWYVSNFESVFPST